MTNPPPPFSPAINGKRHKLPRPTAPPIVARRNAGRVDHVARFDTTRLAVGFEPLEELDRVSARIFQQETADAATVADRL